MDKKTLEESQCARPPTSKGTKKGISPPNAVNASALCIIDYSSWMLTNIRSTDGLSLKHSSGNVDKVHFLWLLYIWKVQHSLSIMFTISACTGCKL